MGQAHVQVVLGGPAMPKGLEAALQRVGATASFGPMSEALRSGVKPTADALVVIPGDNDKDYDGLQALLDQLAAHPRATLVLQAEGWDQQPAHLDGLPVSFSSWADQEELAIRLSTMIDMAASLESLRRHNLIQQQHDEQLAHHYRQQLRLASQVQRGLLPRTLPSYGRVSFSAVYRPMDYVSGDTYDIRRLDDDHLAIALVDAEGHGIGAALLTVFIKRALRGDGRNGNGHWPPHPDEVLGRLNDELLEADLSECPFAAAAYVLVNVRTRRVELARAGAPYPILRRADGSCRLVRPAGSVVGVIPDATFDVESFDLAPGESLLLHSDGVEPIIKAHTPPEWLAPAPSRPPAHVPPDEAITTTGWYQRLRDDGVIPALEWLAARHDTLRRLGRALDDLTALAISVDPDSAKQP